jgi:hypothetical protein
MPETFFKGETQILYFTLGGVDVPVACLTDLSFNESVEMLDTTTQDNQGFSTSRPLNQSYDISFSGVQVESNFAAPSKVSLDLLRIYKRRRQRMDWVIKTGTTFTDSGKCYIIDLSDVSGAEGLLTFSGKLAGYGALPISALEEPLNFIFQNGDNFGFQKEDDNFIFQG